MTLDSNALVKFKSLHGMIIPMALGAITDVDCDRWGVLTSSESIDSRVELAIPNLGQ